MTDSNTIGNELLETTVEKLDSLDCVSTTQVVGSNSKIIAEVSDALGKETLKDKLDDIVTPVYVEIQVA